MKPQDSEIQKFREVISQFEFGISYLKSFIEKYQQHLDSSPLNEESSCMPLTFIEKQPVYSGKSLAELLGVHEKTVKRYRDEGLLGFSQVYDKVFYTPENLRDFLMKFQKHVG